jgi:predicted acetyltransferase
MATLERPNGVYKASFFEAIREFQRAGSGLESTRGLDVARLEVDFDAYVLERLRMNDPKFVSPGLVPQTDFWLVEAGDYIGLLKLRHHLNEALEQIGGHIGYEVRPSRQGRGYATQMLKLGLQAARRLGLRRVLLTCDDDNLASARVMEKNGARLEDVIHIPGRAQPTRRYWIELEGLTSSP